MAYLYYPPTQNGLQKTLDAQLDEGHTTAMTLSNVTGVQNKPGVVVINRIDTSGNEKNASLREYISYTGTSGSTLTGLTRELGGSTDQDHAIGSVVEFIPDITWGQGLIDFLLVDHREATGTHDFTILYDANGNEAQEWGVTASAVNHLKVTNAATGLGPTLEAMGGDTNINLNLKAKGTGKVKVNSGLSITVIDYTTDLTTGDGKAYFTIPTHLNAMVVKAVHARVITAGTTGTTDIQIHNVTDGVDVLSTKLTIDSAETGSDTAAVAAVINTSNDDIATNDLFRIDIDAVSTTAPKGLIVRIEFDHA